MFEKELFKNSVDALELNDGKLCVPMVIANDIINGKKQIIGFVPGLLMKSIKANSIEECETLLSEFTKKEIQNMYEQKENFPFFPTDEEIKNDFDDVIKINHLNIKK